jgi:TPR repeat protein
MNESEKQIALVPVQPSALTKVGAKSLVARGRADLRAKAEAEEWLKKGVDFQNEERYEEAYACFESGIRLNPNHSKLQYVLGVLLESGQGVPQDYEQAAEWYRKAAEQGDPDAQYSLGWLYMAGQGAPQDYAQAAGWFRKSAEQGHSWAQHNLGWLYHGGEGNVPQDYEQAAEWYRKSAEQGDADAQESLGDLYRDGDGVPGTMLRLLSGFARRLSKEMPERNGHSGVCISAVTACPVITQKPISGTI